MPFVEKANLPSLMALGWSDFFDKQTSELSREGDVPARILGEERGRLWVQAAQGPAKWARLSGRLRALAEEGERRPAVGDWVLAQPAHGASELRISALLERRSVLYRKAAGSRTERQVLAANVDRAFIVTSANREMNIKRLQRYISLVAGSGVEPVVVLSKIDLCRDGGNALADETRGQLPGIEVHGISTFLPLTLGPLEQLLGPGTSSVILGSSGVGKSTLVNRLMGCDIRDEQIATQAVRFADDKGRHTTTARHVHWARSGGLVIDTPGMREVQLLDHSSGVREQFTDIESLALGCRFGNCGHTAEPGCAVRAAAEAGRLSEARLSSFLKLLAEASKAELRLSRSKSAARSRRRDRSSWRKANRDWLD